MPRRTSDIRLTRAARQARAHAVEGASADARAVEGRLRVGEAAVEDQVRAQV